MSPRKRTAATIEIDQGLLNHIHKLGLETVEAYHNWCKEQGFSKKWPKHSNQCRREQAEAQKLAAQECLTQRKRETRHFIETLQSICQGKLKESEMTQPYLKRLCYLLRPTRRKKQWQAARRQALLRLFSHLHQVRAKLFDDSPVIAEWGDCVSNTFLEALVLIAEREKDWLRPLKEWKTRSHSAGRQFASLLRHLFVRYDDMPTFFDSVWFSGRDRASEKQREWYLHVGRGQNIRHCDLPIRLTKKMTHHFMQAPNDLTFSQALRWAQVHGLGGNERLARKRLEQFRAWTSCGLQGLEYFEGSLKKENFKCWTIRELLTSKELHTEGRRLRHCVATYVSSCAQGDCSIWTMEMESFTHVEKLLTIEVRKRLICQIRGKYNRLATEKERKVIQRWAEQAGLKIASYA